MDNWTLTVKGAGLHGKWLLKLTVSLIPSDILVAGLPVQTCWTVK